MSPKIVLNDFVLYHQRIKVENLWHRDDHCCDDEVDIEGETTTKKPRWQSTDDKASADVIFIMPATVREK